MSTENIYRSLSPIFYSSKMFALCTFRVSKHGYEKRISGYVYPVFFLTLFVYQSFVDFTTLEVEGDILFVVLDRIQTIESVVNSIVTYMCGIINSRRIMEWADQLHDFDVVMQESFKNNRYQMSLRKLRISSLTSSWLMTLYCLSLLTADAISFIPASPSLGNLNGILTYTLPIFTSTLVVLQFSGGMLAMRDRFEWINGELETLARMWKKRGEIGVEMGGSDDVMIWCNEQNLVEIMENLRHKYYNLHFLTEDLNAIFGLPTALTVLQAFLTLVVYTMYFLKNIGMSSWVKNILYRYFCAGLLIMSFLQICSLSYTSDWLRKEAERAAAILHGIDHLSENLDDFVKHFSNQVLALRVDVTACHLFKINKALIYKIVALVTNYLIVCIQLDI